MIHALLASLIALICISGTNAEAEPLRIAVAANFRATLLALQPGFEAESGATVTISTGATGLLTGQILNGAPFDVFLAADAANPAKLSDAGLGVGAPVTYAIGRLALISRLPAADASTALREADRVAVANPRTAPYGRAAVEAISALGLTGEIEGRLVSARNVTAVLATVESGAAQVGFVAASTLFQGTRHTVWPVDPALHAPLIQQALALTDRPETAAFMLYLTSDAAHRVIAGHGYDVE